MKKRLQQSPARNLVSPFGRDVAQRQRGLAPLWGSWIAALRQDWGSFTNWQDTHEICSGADLFACCPLSHLPCKCQLSQRESQEAGVNCAPDESELLWCRPVRVLLLPSRLAPCHLPQRGRLFVRCLTIWSICVQTSEKFLSICWFENRITNRWYDSKTAVLSLSYAIPCVSLCCAPSSSMTSLAAWQ